MNFCSKCGHELNERDSFCSECGERVQKPVREESRPQQTEPPAVSDEDSGQAGASPATGEEAVQAPGEAEPVEHSVVSDPEPQGPQAARELPIPRRRMSGVAKLLIALAVIVVVALAGGYIAGTMVFSPDRMIESFRQAVEDKDVDKLMKLVRPRDDDMSVTKQDILRLAEYYRDHESDLEDAVDSLKSQADGGSVSRKAALQLVEDGKEFLLFDRYIIEVQAYYMTLHTNLAETELLIDGDEVAVAREDEYSKRFGPYWPGEYDVKAVFAGEYTTLTQSQAVKLYDERETDVVLQIEAGFVQIDSEIDEAIVYVNGESTGRTVSDFDGIIGPVTFDGQITLHAEAEFPWGTFQSEPIELTAELENALVPFLFEEAYITAQEQVMDAVNEFLASWAPAYENMDISLFTNITEERRSLFASDFQWMLETGQRFTGQIVGTEFDLNSFMIDGGYDGYPYSAVIDVAYILGEAAWYYLDEEPQLEEMVSFIEYELVYDDIAGRWVISYFTGLDEIDFSNTQAYTYE